MAGIVAIPGLAGIGDTFKKSVKGTDVLVGAVVGLGGIVALKYVKGFIGSKVAIPAIVERVSPALAGGLAGLVLYYAQKKKNPGRATGHAVGAVAAGVAMNVATELKAQFPQYFADVVDLQLHGLIVNDPARLNGMIVTDTVRPSLRGYADDPGMAGLAALSMEVDDEDHAAAIGY